LASKVYRLGEIGFSFFFFGASRTFTSTTTSFVCYTGFAASSFSSYLFFASSAIASSFFNLIILFLNS
jgi:hypothetical protein